MSFRHLANQDFERAHSRAFWRKIIARLTGESIDLLPFEEVRARLRIEGQRSIGLQQVAVDHIVGSLGRYHDFDRAFLPLQTRTRGRWVSIDQAHYEETPLPPVELYKLGDIYFVKDGNHRVSVARERGQIYVDAYVLEMDSPIPLSPSVKVDELEMEAAQVDFQRRTALAGIEAGAPEAYRRLLEHIDVHRWYLGEQRQAEVPYEEAAQSWFENVYRPLENILHEVGLDEAFPRVAAADLYLWVMEYQGYLRKAFANAEGPESDPKAEAARLFLEQTPQPQVRRLVQTLNRADWLDELMLAQERAAFLRSTHLDELKPGIVIELTLPEGYAILIRHIEAHAWYLGEQKGASASPEEAAISWVERVYQPLVDVIREQEILARFPGRTEADLYLWIIEHQWFLREDYGEEVPLDEAVQTFANGQAQSIWEKLRRWIKERW